MKRIILIYIVLLVVGKGFAQIATILPSTESVANTGVAARDNRNAFCNPANTAFAESIEAGIQYENRYFLKELANRSINAILPTKYVNISLAGSYFGYSYSNEILAGIGFSRNFSDAFSLGVQFNYLTAYFAAQNRYRSAFFPQIGANVRLSSAIYLGFSVFNPFQQNIKTEYAEKRLPSVFSLGMDYRLGEDFKTRLEIDKEISSNFRLAAGFEYSMLNAITLKLGGYHLNYFVPCLGFGVNFGNISFTLNGELHPQLGLVTMGGARYRF
ncbi:MAG: hypothetical protein LBN23_04010 [Paludibacter sp.]|jgi:hypothetical protein|nr:hypothetical protein [Paludibacter sp.]